ncbi:MAG: NAD(P)-dependent oxidoreductase [Deltaproteobacteria bacterium]|nr:NAD(P)-dependent oxidoreductase [Deltaproteobacteria bacterium]
MRIGFIGLGNMGGPMASHILAAGHTLTVHDVRREAANPHLERGARWADSPMAVAAASEIVFTSLPGPKEVESVALGEGGILQGAAPGAIYIDLSTSSPTLIRRIHALYQERKVHVLDAPVSGGPIGAQQATLAVMVGGDPALYQQVKPVLDVIGNKVTYIGVIGCGAIAKLVHNMIGICQQLILAEGFTLGVKAGVDPEALRQAVVGGAVGQGLMLNYAMPEVIFKGDFDTVRFALRLARKDIGLATELGREFNVPLKIANITEQELVEGIARGWGERDSSAPFTLQEERAGVKVRRS